MAMTEQEKSERIAKLKVMRTAAEDALLAAYSALNYSIAGRSKQMADPATLKAQIDDYTREINALENDGGGIEVVTGIPIDR